MAAIEYRVLHLSDFDAVYDYDVYMNTMFNAHDYKLPDIKAPDDKSRVADFFTSTGLSIGAFDTTTGQLVGIQLCTVGKRTRDDAPIFDINDPKIQNMAIILTGLTDGAMVKGLDVFGKDEEIVKFSGLEILDSHEKQGIGYRLVEEAIKVIREKGYKAVLAEVVSTFLSNIMEKCGLEHIKKL